MPEGITPLTRKPKTAYEWLENVRSRGGDDADWAHRILQRERNVPHSYLKDLMI